MTGGRALLNIQPPLYNTDSGLTLQAIANDCGPPPSYEEAINPNAPPPSYDTLFGKVCEAQKNSTGVLDFIKNVIIIILGTLGCSLILGITIVIPICMIVMGSVYLHDCPQGEYIPIYLLVGVTICLKLDKTHFVSIIWTHVYLFMLLSTRSVTDVHDYPTWNRDNFYVNMISTNYGQNHIFHNGLIKYNNLPSEIRSSRNSAMFRNECIKYFLDNVGVN